MRHSNTQISYVGPTSLSQFGVACPHCLIQRDLHLLNENPKNRAEAPNPELDAVHAQLLQVDKVLPSDQKLIIVE